MLVCSKSMKQRKGEMEKRKHFPPKDHKCNRYWPVVMQIRVFCNVVEVSQLTTVVKRADVAAGWSGANLTGRTFER